MLSGDSNYPDAGVSTVTLVNLRPQPQVKLVITNFSALNNVLTVDGIPRYIISTIDVAGAKTIISDARTEQVLAEINRKTLFPDEITLTRHEGGRTLKIGKEWLKESKMPDGRARYDFEMNSVNFTWKVNVATRLALFLATDLSNPVAWMQFPVEGKVFALLVPPGLHHFWDVIIAGWSIAELKLKMEEKSYNIGSAMGMVQSGMAGNATVIQ